jgi:GDP-L-fucose synthase
LSRMDKTARIFVAGHRGLVGSAIVRRLHAEGCTNLVLAGRDTLDLRVQSDVSEFFEGHRPEYVFLAAAKVGGILANSTHPAEFLSDNLAIQTNVIDAAHRHGARKLLFLGSSCIYPKFAEQPIREESLLTGALEPTNEWYAIAKIAGLKLADAFREQFGDDFISAMPTNLYGPGDNFDPRTSHALPAMIYKFHHAKQSGAQSVTLWGTGTPRREWLHVSDAAEACLVLLEKYSDAAPINIGVGADQTIMELAGMVGEAIGYKGEIKWDTTMPDGTPRKLLDVTRIRKLGWKPQIALKTGIREVYQWFTQKF